MTERGARLAGARTELEWRKSSYSGNSGGDCVEIATSPPMVAVRDSKNPDGGTLVLAPAAWTGFLKILRDDAGSSGQV